MSTSTLFVALIAVSATIAISIAVVALRHSLSMALWAGAFGSLSLAFLLIALRGQISDFLSVIVANVALSAGFALFIKGVWRFQRRNSHNVLVWFPTSLVTAFLHVFPENEHARILVINSMLAAQTLYCLASLWRWRQQTAGRGQFVAMAGFLVIAATFSSRIFSAVTGQIPSVLANNSVQAATILSVLVGLVLSGAGFASMIQERAQHELDESRKVLKDQHTRLQQYAADLQSANVRLMELSITDGLTGLANRRRFDEVLENEWARARREAKSLTLFLLDVDFFKRYNDKYGHLAGDDCLRQIANVLQSRLNRPNDLVARYGGEEFAIIATDLDRKKSENFAHEICKEVAELKIPHAQSPHETITVSVGIAAIIPSESDSIESLIKSADGALYDAKHDGRNRVRLA